MGEMCFCGGIEGEKDGFKIIEFILTTILKSRIGPSTALRTNWINRFGELRLIQYLFFFKMLIVGRIRGWHKF